MAQRARRRAELLKRAASVVVPAQTDVCIVGGGAAGLVAAIHAAEYGAHTVVLERDAECGRTILATGNGRCNFANTSLNPALFNHPEFVEAVCGNSWLADVLSFFESCGLAWEEEEEGRLYPLSRQAASVRNILLTRAQTAGVTLAPARDVRRIRRTADGLDITYCCEFKKPDDAHLHAHSLIIATGGGSTTLLDLGIPEKPATPALCPLACDGPLLTELDGRRVRVRARLERKGCVLLEERGEVLFRAYGLSGIVIFNFSRHARPNDTIVLDLLPGIDDTRASKLGRTTLDGLLDPAISQALLASSGSRERALTQARALTYRVLGPAEGGQAQLTRGGLAVEAFDPTSLQLATDEHIGACGEALDIDGPCGGFNLAWAWKSGMVAGTAAARKVTA